MFGTGSHSDFGNHRMSVTSDQFIRTVGRSSISKKPGLTLSDLEFGQPFGNLKNIDRQKTKFTSKHHDQWDSTFGFSAAEKIQDDVKRTQNYLQSVIDAYETATKRHTQKPVTSPPVRTSAQEQVTSRVSRPTDIRPSTQEPVTLSVPRYTDRPSTGAQKPVTSQVPRYSDMRPSKQEPVTSAFSRYTGIRPSTEEPMTLSVPRYTVRPSTGTQETVTSAVPRYSDVRRSTQEPVTSSQCATNEQDKSAAATFCPGWNFL